jgi:hypothetical protein
MASALFIRKEKSNKMQQCIKIFIVPYLYEAQHVLGDTPPIIRSQNCTGSLWFFIIGRLFGRVVCGRFQAQRA